VPLDAVYADHSYLCPLEPERMQQKVAQLRIGEELGEGLLAHRPDGTFWIVDGQHRVAATRLCALTEMTFLVFDSLGREHERAIQNTFAERQARLRPMIESDLDGTLHIDTRLVAAGSDPNLAAPRAVNAGVTRASKVLFAGSAALEAAKRAGRGTFFYGRFGTPTVAELERALCELEGGEAAFATPSGLSAAMTAIRAFARNGDHLLVADNCYRALKRSCQTLAGEAGIGVTVCPPDAFSSEATVRTRAMVVQNPGHDSFDVLDTGALATLARAKDMRLIVDNTWATPLFYRPLLLGADVVVHSLTKSIGGHDDIVMGAIVGRPGTSDAIAAIHRSSGIAVSSDDAYLALRGLRTLAVRLEKQSNTALRLATWLKTQPQVARVCHPALESGSAGAIFRRDFTGCGPTFSFALHERDVDRVRRGIDSLRLFKHGVGYGGVRSLVTMKEVPAMEKAQWLVRLGIGLEHGHDLKRDLASALDGLAVTPD
jgi:cystathionine beta-lyase